MLLRFLLVLVAGLSLGGCVSTQFTALAAGVVPAASLEVSVDDALWNKAPGVMTAHLTRDSQMWTRDGVLLDQLLLIGPIANDQAMFVSRSETLVYPVFRRNMLPNEVLELVQSTLGKNLGADTLVESANLRPVPMGDLRAIAFDLDVVSADSPSRKGRAVAFVEQEKLYVLLYLAAGIHYFDKHWPNASRVINSARIATSG